MNIIFFTQSQSPVIWSLLCLVIWSPRLLSIYHGTVSHQYLSHSTMNNTTSDSKKSFHPLPAMVLTSSIVDIVLHLFSMLGWVTVRHIPRRWHHPLLQTRLGRHLPAVSAPPGLSRRCTTQWAGHDGWHGAWLLVSRPPPSRWVQN